MTEEPSLSHAWYGQ